MLEILDLAKRYGPVVALDGATFSARPGRIVGFLGPNGAGKTTTMRADEVARRVAVGRGVACGRRIAGAVADRGIQVRAGSSGSNRPGVPPRGRRRPARPDRLADDDARPGRDRARLAARRQLGGARRSAGGRARGVPSGRRGGRQVRPCGRFAVRSGALRGWRKGLDAEAGAILASGVSGSDDLDLWCARAVETAERRL